MEICHQYPWRIKKSMVNTELILWVVGRICAQFIAIFHRNDNTSGLDPDICTVEERSPVLKNLSCSSKSSWIASFRGIYARSRTIETWNNQTVFLPLPNLWHGNLRYSWLNIPQFTCLNGLRFWMSNSQFRPPGRGLKTLRLWDDPRNLTQWVFHDSSHQMICK